MLRYALKRLLHMIPTLLGVTLLTFFLFNVVGGKSLALLELGKNATQESVDAYNKLHGYDRPLPVRYGVFLGKISRGDLGFSSDYKQPVAQVIREGAKISLCLTIPLLLIGLLAALSAGLICAAFAGRGPDRATLAVTTVIMSVNYVIWVTTGQYVFAYKLGVFPVWGFENWTYLILPVIIGVLSGIGGDTRLYRTLILDEIRRPHVRTAIAKGLHPSAVLLKHVLRNSLVTVVTNVSLAVPFLFVGSILLESFYGIPGLGGIGLNAVNSSDYDMVRAVVLIGSALYQVSNLAGDLIVAALDPRVRLARV